MKSKFLSIVLSVLMLFTTALPVHVVYADDDPVIEEEQVVEVEDDIALEDVQDEIVLEEIQSDETTVEEISAEKENETDVTESNFTEEQLNAALSFVEGCAEAALWNSNRYFLIKEVNVADNDMVLTVSSTGIVDTELSLSYLTSDSAVFVSGYDRLEVFASGSVCFNGNFYYENTSKYDPECDIDLASEKDIDVYLGKEYKIGSSNSTVNFSNNVELYCGSEKRYLSSSENEYWNFIYVNRNGVYYFRPSQSLYDIGEYQLKYQVSYKDEEGAVVVKDVSRTVNVYAEPGFYASNYIDKSHYVPSDEVNVDSVYNSYYSIYFYDIDKYGNITYYKDSDLIYDHDILEMYSSTSRENVDVRGINPDTSTTVYLATDSSKAVKVNSVYPKLVIAAGNGAVYNYNRVSNHLEAQFNTETAFTVFYYNGSSYVDVTSKVTGSNETYLKVNSEKGTLVYLNADREHAHANLLYTIDGSTYYVSVSGVNMPPADLELKMDESTGEFYITCSDKEYLRKCVEYSYYYPDEDIKDVNRGLTLMTISGNYRSGFSNSITVRDGVENKRDCFVLSEDGSRVILTDSIKKSILNNVGNRFTYYFYHHDDNGDYGSWNDTMYKRFAYDASKDPDSLVLTVTQNDGKVFFNIEGADAEILKEGLLNGRASIWSCVTTSNNVNRYYGFIQNYDDTNPLQQDKNGKIYVTNSALKNAKFLSGTYEFSISYYEKDIYISCDGVKITGLNSFPAATQKDVLYMTDIAYPVAGTTIPTSVNVVAKDAKGNKVSTVSARWMAGTLNANNEVQLSTIKDGSSFEGGKTYYLQVYYSYIPYADKYYDTPLYYQDVKYPLDDLKIAGMGAGGGGFGMYVGGSDTYYVPFVVEPLPGNMSDISDIKALAGDKLSSVDFGCFEVYGDTDLVLSAGTYEFKVYYQTDGSEKWQNEEGYNPDNQRIERTATVYVFVDNYIDLEMFVSDDGSLVVTGNEYFLRKLCEYRVYTDDGTGYPTFEGDNISLTITSGGYANYENSIHQNENGEIYSSDDVFSYDDEAGCVVINNKYKYDILSAVSDGKLDYYFWMSGFYLRVKTLEYDFASDPASLSINVRTDENYLYVDFNGNLGSEIVDSYIEKSYEGDPNFINIYTEYKDRFINGMIINTDEESVIEKLDDNSIRISLKTLGEKGFVDGVYNIGFGYMDIEIWKADVELLTGISMPKANQSTKITIGNIENPFAGNEIPEQVELTVKDANGKVIDSVVGTWVYFDENGDMQFAEGTFDKDVEYSLFVAYWYTPDYNKIYATKVYYGGKLYDSESVGWGTGMETSLDTQMATEAVIPFKTLVGCKINYELYGGVNNKANPDNYVTSDTGSFTLSNPTKEGYRFSGWYNEDGEKVTKIYFNVTEDQTVYAKWEALTYRVTYNANGGKGSIPASAYVSYPYPIKLSSNEDDSITRQGYSFVGWSLEKNGEALDRNFVFTPSKDKQSITLYALWSDVKVEDLTIVSPAGEEDKVELASGKSVQLSVKVNPDNALNKKVSWSIVSGADYGTISSSGKFTASKSVNQGAEVVVKAVAQDGSKKEDTITIAITPVVEKVTISCEGRDVTNSIVGAELGKDYEVILSSITYPSDASDAVVWKSSNTKVATVENGVVTINETVTKKTTVKITATAADGSNKSASVTINIAPLVKTLNLVSATGSNDITATKSLQLNTNINADAANKSLTWVYDKSLVSVSSSGKVTAKKVNEITETVIKAYAKDGSLMEDDITLRIIPISTAVTITDNGKDVSKSTIYVDQKTLTYDLSASTSPVDAADGITWTSSSSKLASVDKNGHVTFTGNKGKVKITATATDGSGKNTYVYFNIVKQVEKVDIAVKGNLETEIAAGKSLQLVASVEPTDATNKKVLWSLPEEDKAYATVNSSGKLTANKNLTEVKTVTVICSPDDGGKPNTIDVTLYPVTASVSIMDENHNPLKALNGAEYNSTVQLTFKNSSASGSADPIQSVVWTSSSKAVAEVDDSGLVTFKAKKGTVTITATAADGSGKKVSVKFNVVERLTESLTVTAEKNTVVKGKFLQLTAVTSREDGKLPTNTSLNWTSSDKKIATVDSKGKVKGIKEGTAVITVSTSDGSGLTYSYPVYVVSGDVLVKIYRPYPKNYSAILIEVYGLDSGAEKLENFVLNGVEIGDVYFGGTHYYDDVLKGYGITYEHYDTDTEYIDQRQPAEGKRPGEMKVKLPVTVEEYFGLLEFDEYRENGISYSFEADGITYTGFAVNEDLD